MKKFIYCLLFAQILFYCGCSEREQSEFPFYAFDGNRRGKQIGLLIPVENSGVLKMFVSVDKIKPGNYSLYLHEDAKSCRAPKEAISGNIVKTQFPLLDGSDGTIRVIIISRDLTMQDLRGRSLIIHETTENIQANASSEQNSAKTPGDILSPAGKGVACVNIPHKKKR